MILTAGRVATVITSVNVDSSDAGDRPLVPHHLLLTEETLTEDDFYGSLCFASVVTSSSDAGDASLVMHHLLLTKETLEHDAFLVL